MVLVERIAADSDIVFGKPRIQGTRLAVEFILDLLAAGATEEYLLRNYPNLTHEDILACLSYAGRIVSEIRFWPIAA